MGVGDEDSRADVDASRSSTKVLAPTRSWVDLLYLIAATWYGWRMTEPEGRLRPGSAVGRPFRANVMNAAPAVEALNLAKHFGETVAVDDVSFVVRRAACSACWDPTAPARRPLSA